MEYDYLLGQNRASFHTRAEAHTAPLGLSPRHDLQVGCLDQTTLTTTTLISAFAPLTASSFEARVSYP